MQLGVNFSPAPEQAPGFNVDAVRALRPALVRIMIQDPTALPTWIASARRLRLQVLWSLPVELIGLQAAQLGARMLAAYGADVTWGLEVGYAPWFIGQTAEEYIAAALPVVAEARQGLRRGQILLGAGYDAAPRASAWLAELLKVGAGSAIIRQCFAGVTASLVTPGRRPRVHVMRGAALRVHAAWGLPLAFTRAGWPLGMRLRPLETLRELLAGEYSPMADARVFGVLTPRIRRAWMLGSYEFARSLQSPCFIAEHDPKRAGVHTWSLFDPIESRPDPLWIAVQWHHARLERAAG